VQIVGKISERNDKLTSRELDIIKHVAIGEENKEIAKNLCITEKTVKNHISHIFSKLSINSRAQLVVYSYRHRITTFDILW
jgi:DNA-binding NarL/FixJ family response regulator